METQKWPNKDELKQLSLEELEALYQEELPTNLRGHVLLQTAHKYNHAGNSPEKIPQLLDDAIAIGQQLDDSSILIYAHGAYGWYYMKTYDHLKAFEHMQKARQLAIDYQDKEGEQKITKILAALFSRLGYSDKAVKIQEEVYAWESENDELSVATCSSLGALLANDHQYEKAQVYYKEALNLKTQKPSNEEKLILLENLSIANLKLDRYDEASEYAKQLEEFATGIDNAFFLHRSYCLYAALHSHEEQWEDSLNYGIKAHDYLAELDWVEKLVELTEILMKGAAALSKHELAYNYAEKFIAYQKQLDNEEGKRKAYQFDYQLDLEKREKEFEIQLATTRLQTLTKIASNIAHEVQNPLQFVKNFSELNVDLGEDLQTCLQEENYPEANEITNDMLLNSYKIRDYGIRISKIVDQLMEQTRKAEAGELEVDTGNKLDFSK